MLSIKRSTLNQLKSLHGLGEDEVINDVLQEMLLQDKSVSKEQVKIIEDE